MTRSTLEARFAAIMAPHRFILGLVGVFSAIALGLAALGIYGLFAESVAERVPEIGVRLALGATTTAVLRLILVEGARLIAIGLAIGMAAALALHRTMTSLVFGVATTDPTTYLAAALVLAAAALTACAIPARRAARIDPVRALRQE